MSVFGNGLIADIISKRRIYKPRNPKSAANPRGQNGQGRMLPYRFRKTTLLAPQFGTSGLQNYERIDFCCLKPPSVWCFVRAAASTLNPSLRVLLQLLFLIVQNGRISETVGEYRSSRD